MRVRTPCASTRRVGTLGTALRATIATIAASSVVLLARSAQADDVRVERASGAEGCPDAASFGARVREGSDRAHEGEPTRDVTVRFERTTKGFRSSVLTSDGMKRSLVDDASTCEPLAEATLLAVRMTLDLAASPPAPPVNDVPAAPPAPPAAVVAPETRDAREAPTTPRTKEPASVGLEVLASGTLALGVGSPLAPGFRAGAAATLGRGRWSLGVTGVVLSTQTREVGTGSVDIGVAGGGIEGCGRARALQAVVLALCGRAEALRLSGTAHGFARTEEHARPLLLGSLLGRGQMRIAGPVAAYAEVGAVVPIVRERFSIDRVGLVYDPPIIAGSGAFGALVDFE